MKINGLISAIAFLLLSLLVVSSKAFTSTSEFKTADSKTVSSDVTLPKLSFLDEWIIDKNQTYKNTTVGGLSSIDFLNGHVYMISDHGHYDKDSVLGQPRFYQAKLEIEGRKIADLSLVAVHSLLPESQSSLGFDPESLRVFIASETNNSTSTNSSASINYIWSSEGDIKQGINGNVYQGILNKQSSDLNSVVSLPSYFEITDKTGPHHNAVFEGLDVAQDNSGFWLAMEGPLKQDGQEPTKDNGALVRLSYVSSTSGEIEKQFAIPVEPLPEEPDASAKAFRTTGIVEILQYDASRFMVIERAYTSGLADGGNRVKLYLVDIAGATDVKSMISLKNQRIKVAKKHLLLDMADLQSKLHSGRVDNIEGISFGPLLESGEQTLLLVSDNNFNAYEEQVSQIILLQID